jgi:ribonuclease VapC
VIVDSSALMAILEGEPAGEACLQAAAAGPCSMSTATWLEVGIVADQRSTGHGERLDDLVSLLEIDLVPVTERQAQVARAAYRRFGRGTGSPARLNLGDCFAYALSVVSGEPLLYVGEDFSHTDVVRARLPHT